MKLLNGIIYPVDMSLSKSWEIVEDREAWCATAHWAAKSCTWLSGWTRTGGMMSFFRGRDCLISSMPFNPSTWYDVVTVIFSDFSFISSVSHLLTTSHFLDHFIMMG